MKKAVKFFGIMILATLIAVSCGKDDNNGGLNNRNGNRKGTIKLSSVSNNPYKIYIDGIYKCNIAGHQTQTFDKKPGNYSVRVLQSSGYVLYPTDQTFSVTVIADQTTTLYFPE